MTFRNEASGEYLFYFLNLRATPPGVMSSVEMTTPVRQTASASVTLDNPLPGTLSFTAECRCPDVSLPPQLSVPGLAKVGLAQHSDTHTHTHIITLSHHQTHTRVSSMLILPWRKKLAGRHGKIYISNRAVRKAVDQQ